VSQKKERLDVLLVDKGLAPSREKAKTIIMTGNVFVNGQREDKAGTKIKIDSDIMIKSNPIPFVSRGGLKLDKAVKEFNIKLQDDICMDVGASTGGFTDCMLKNGAKKVYSIDVGYGQFDWGLRQDDRVVCMEKTNIRYVTKEQIPDEIDFVSIDVSFISLTKVLIPVKELMKNGGEIICLIKPQFEAGREKVGKKGVVREIVTHYEVVCKIVNFAKSINFHILDFSFSPIKGPEGNIEYLVYMKKNDNNKECSDNQDNNTGELDVLEENFNKFKKIIDKAHETL
jgi:23S rRNA (cytidine1920-2'-O)/16S rRNA (cytidine1409-2'-O)-methyltransferase